MNISLLDEAKKLSPLHKHRVIIVPETHWDRDWYLPFEVFRRKLVSFMDRLINCLESDSRFSCFTLDGQTILLEDYLAIRPEKRDVLRKLIGDKRLRVGPWYVLPDEFLVSGESLVRNLLIGMRMSKEFNGGMLVGYMPDSFGHVAQLPQILRGFQIDNFIFMRGVIPQLSDVEFIWEAPDGSRVLASHQRERYDNASFLGYPIVWGENERITFNMDEALEQIETATQKLGAESHIRTVLLNNGVDHSEVQEELPEIVAKAREKWRGAEIVIGGFDDYIEHVRRELDDRKLEVKRHELLYPFGNLLRGVNSSRVYLKQANHICESLLIRYVEPLSLVAGTCLPERPDDSAIIDHAWRELLKCQPHDDICGCSVDPVHREMMAKFAGVEQLALALAEDAFRDIANQMDHASIPGIPMVFFNPACAGRRGALRASLLFELQEKELVEQGFQLVTAAGQKIEHELLGSRRKIWCEVRKVFDMYSVDVLLADFELPPCGFSTLYAQPAELSPAVPQMLPRRVTMSRKSIENEYLRVEVADDGSYALFDKLQNRQFPRLGWFEDQEDCGDEYTWSDLTCGRIINSTDFKPEIVISENTRLGGCITIHHRMLVPSALEEDRLSRSSAMVELPIRTELELLAGSRRLDVRTTINNTAEDHRVRVLFPTPFHVKSVNAGGSFETVRRVVNPNDHPQYHAEYDSPLYPMEHFRGFVHVGESTGGGLCVMAKGICEYEAMPTEEGVTLALTLFRSVGWLSRDDFPRRMYPSGPSLETPDAQMPGEWAFEYSLYPVAREVVERRPPSTEYDVYALAPMCDRGDRHGSSIVLNQEARTRSVPRSGILPDSFSILRLEPEQLVLSTIKHSTDGQGWIVRFYNDSSEIVTARIEFAFEVRELVPVRLDESPEGFESLGSGRSFIHQVGPGKIISLKAIF